ncbi:MAG: hypothetical protein HOW73_31090 [Polyangiaceae bacterium]|nr:hypothetical protein [Polyangiaceae bacterium]
MKEADDEAEELEPPLKLVCFYLRDQELALPIDCVRETIRVRPIARVFLTPSWLAGIFSLRGEIVPAVDLAPWLGMPPTIVGDETRLVVLRHPTKVIAILVDGLAELRVLRPSDVVAPPSTLSTDQAVLLSGLAATPTGTVRILAPNAILGSERLRSLGAASTSPTTEREAPLE